MVFKILLRSDSPELSGSIPRVHILYGHVGPGGEVEQSGSLHLSPPGYCVTDDAQWSASQTAASHTEISLNPLSAKHLDSLPPKYDTTQRPTDRHADRQTHLTSHHVKSDAVSWRLWVSGM